MCRTGRSGHGELLAQFGGHEVWTGERFSSVNDATGRRGEGKGGEFVGICESGVTRANRDELPITKAAAFRVRAQRRLGIVETGIVKGRETSVFR